MKILIISNMYPSEQKPYSGIFVKNQYEYLRNELKQNISIYTMRRSFTTKIGSILKYLKFYFGFFTFLFRKYEIVHIHFFGYHAFLGYIYKIFYPNVKLIITFHGGDTKNIERSTFKMILNQVNTIIAVGKEQSEYIFKQTSFNNIKVIPAGIDEKVFYKEDYNKKKYDFIFIGSFYNVKGIDIFIDAIKELKNKDLNYCFVGSGKYLSDIEALKNSFKIDIKENQTQNEIRFLLNQSKWLILPSRGDSFGLVVSEAMYCATPAIVSNIGGMVDQVENNFNGFILKENTSEELSKVINKLINIEPEEYNRLALNASKSNKQYSMNNVCMELSLIYKELLDEN